MRVRNVCAALLVASSITGCALFLGLEDDYRDDRSTAGADGSEDGMTESGVDGTTPTTDASDSASDAGGDATTDANVDSGDGDGGDGGDGGGIATAIGAVGGLAAWFSGDVGVATNGNAVTTWTSHGGAPIVATPIANAAAPSLFATAINGLPAVHLDGTPGSGTCPCPGFGAALAASLAQPVTIVAVVKNTRWADLTYNYRGILLATAILPPQYIKLHGHVVGGPAPVWAITGTGMIATNPFDDPGFRAAHVIVAVLDGASSLVRIDGVERATGSIGTAPFGTGFTIGNEGSPLSSFQGDIAELAIFGRALGAADAADVESTFKTKYATP